MQIRKTRVKKGQRTNLSQTKEIENIIKDILKNKINQIKENTNLPQNILEKVEKKKEII